MRLQFNTLGIIMVSGLLTACATLSVPKINTENYATIHGIVSNNCDPRTNSTCRFATIRRLDGVNALAQQNPNAPDDASATHLATFLAPPGLHTIELSYRCGQGSTEQAALYQLPIAAKALYQVKWVKGKQTCYPVITGADGTRATPLIQYLAN